MNRPGQVACVGSPASEAVLANSMEDVRRIVLAGLGAARVRVYLFGSRATGGAREGSDIDVAVLPLEPLTPGLLARIRDALEESRVPWTVDLVDLSTASPALRERVEREGVPWND